MRKKQGRAACGGAFVTEELPVVDMTRGRDGEGEEDLGTGE